MKTAVPASLVIFIGLFATACGTTLAAKGQSATSNEQASQSARNKPNPSSPSSSSAGSQIQGYIASFTNAVYFFSPFVNGTSQFYEAYDKSQNNPKVVSQSSQVSINQSGNNVQVTFQSLVFGPNSQSQLTGTLSGQQLVIMVPQSDGSLNSLTFYPGAISQYNRDVQQLKQQVSQQQQAIAQQAATQHAQQRISSAVQTVLSDIQQIKSSQNDIQSALSSMSDALQQEQNDLTKTRQQLQSEESLAQKYPNGDNGEIGYQSGEVSYDEGTVSYDQGAVQYYNPSSAISSLAAFSSQIQQDFTSYQNAQSQLPNYTPSSVPTSGMVNNAINTIGADVTKDKSVLNQAVASAQQMVDTAKGYVQTANQVAAAH